MTERMMIRLMRLTFIVLSWLTVVRSPGHCEDKLRPVTASVWAERVHTVSPGFRLSIQCTVPASVLARQRLGLKWSHTTLSTSPVTLQELAESGARIPPNPPWDLRI